jgi:hypothetical protein
MKAQASPFFGIPSDRQVLNGVLIGQPASSTFAVLGYGLIFDQQSTQACIFLLQSSSFGGPNNSPPGFVCGLWQKKQSGSLAVTSSPFGGWGV